jgi:hypothetical protein
MPTVLVSLCNEYRLAEKGILRYDVGERTASWITIGLDGDVPITGTLGIYGFGSRIYAVYSVGWDSTRMTIFENDGALSVAADLELPDVKDPHSIWVDAERLLVVSTGTNELFEYALSDGVPRGAPSVIWRAADAATDTMHLNSVTVHEGRILISAFGPQDGDSWESACNGYIRDIERDAILQDGLLHPHSLRSFGGDVFFIESVSGRLRSLRGAEARVDGYARGCESLGGDLFLVGTNVARAGRAVPAGACGIALVDLEGGATREFHDLGAYGREVYDLWLA